MGDKVGVNGCLMNKVSDVTGGDMASRTHKTKRGSRGATLGEDAGNTPGQRLDGAEPGPAGGVMNCCTALAVFLVVKIKTHRIGRAKLCQWSVVRKDVALFEKPHVLASELDGAGAGF